jgi:type II secretory ATPase GspE/PulE/Tfp pilus assembly ATPase PilB-like protein
MAQRLVRRLCPHCRKEVLLTGHTKDVVDHVLGTIKNRDELFRKVSNKIFEPVGVR